MADAALGCICHGFVVVLKLCAGLQIPYLLWRIANPPQLENSHGLKTATA